MGTIISHFTKKKKKKAEVDIELFVLNPEMILLVVIPLPAFNHFINKYVLKD